MTKLNETRLADLLQACLASLDAGMTMEETLENIPKYKDEIQPVLEAALAARQHGDAEIPAAALQRSRTRLLVRAEQIRKEADFKKSRRIPYLRLGLQLVSVVIVLGASLTSLFAASAQTIPGDNLYRVKRLGEEARLTLSSPETRERLLNAYRGRRIDEIEELLRLGRSAPIAFEGVVNNKAPGQWVIGGLEVVISENTLIVGTILPGMLVEIQGQTTANSQINASRVYLRAYAFAGTIEEFKGQIWLIDGVPVLVTDESQLAPGLSTGMQVVVLAKADNDGTISARAILHADGGPVIPGDILPGEAAVETPSPSPTTTPAPASTPVPTAVEGEVLEDESETQEEDHSGPGSTQEPDETEDPGETAEPTNEPDETEEPDESQTPESTETEDPDDSSNSGSGSTPNTPEPTETEDPTRTPEPTETPDPTDTPDD